MEIDCNDRVEENRKLKNGGYVAKFENDRRIDKEETSELIECHPIKFRCFFLSTSKKLRIILYC